jgi:hypothetical protein
VALYVDPRGPYPDLVREWYDEKRDARTYAGPWPVVAHPPCERWGDQFHGCFPADHPKRRHLGDDGETFVAALLSVRTYGGVIEHPAHSKAWNNFGLPKPSHRGWTFPDRFGGRSASIEQGHWGHKARKPTWLYAVGAPVVTLPLGPSEANVRLDKACSHEARYRSMSPVAFAEWLVSLAAQARRP